MNDQNKKAIQDLCRAITVAHNLDEEIQEELYGHIEDKVLAYCAGEETVTEEDAIILAREHFGDPKIIQNMMAKVHPHAVSASMEHRLAVALVLCVILQSFGMVLRPPWMAAIMHAAEWADAPLIYLVTSQLLGVMPTLLFLLLFLWITNKWQHQLDTGTKPRFMSLRLASLIKIALAFWLISWTLPTITSNAKDWTSFFSTDPHFNNYRFLYIGIPFCVDTLLKGGFLLALLRWCTPRGTELQLALGICGLYCLFAQLSVIVQHISPSLFVLERDQQLAWTLHVLPNAHEHISQLASVSVWLTFMAIFLLNIVLPACLALLVYWRLNKTHSQPNDGLMIAR